MTTHPLDEEWLRKNGGERMDATLTDVFPADRRRFHLARYGFAADRVCGLRVADVACGTGYGSAIMRRTGAASVVGVDINPEAVSYATRTHGTSDVRFVSNSAESTGLPDASVDAVVSFETLEHVPNDKAALNEFCRILSPGGALICSVPNNWGLSQYHVRNYTRDTLMELLTPSFGVTLWNQNSGSIGSHHNHGQPAGLTRTTNDNYMLAECFVAVGIKR